MLKVRAEAVIDALAICAAACDLEQANRETAGTLGLIVWYLHDNRDKFKQQMQAVADVGLSLSFGNPPAPEDGKKLAAARRQMIRILEEDERA
jgi:hypothetical protein